MSRNEKDDPVPSFSPVEQEKYSIRGVIHVSNNVADRIASGRGQ
jgi:hypothetical protein